MWPGKISADVTTFIALQSPPVTYQGLALPLSQILAEISVLAGQSLSASSKVANEICLLRVHDISLNALLNQIATVMEASWTRDDRGNLKLEVSPADEKHRHERAAAVRLPIIKKCLTALKKQDAAHRDYPPDVLCSELIAAIAPTMLAYLNPNQRHVFSSQPNARQLAFTENICLKIDSFAANYEAWYNGQLKQPRPLAQIGKINLSYCYDDDNRRLEFQLDVYDKAGNIISAANVQPAFPDTLPPNAVPVEDPGEPPQLTPTEKKQLLADEIDCLVNHEPLLWAAQTLTERLTGNIIFNLPDALIFWGLDYEKMKAMPTQQVLASLEDFEFKIDSVNGWQVMTGPPDTPRYDRASFKTYVEKTNAQGYATWHDIGNFLAHNPAGVMRNMTLALLEAMVGRGAFFGQEDTELSIRFYQALSPMVWTAVTHNQPVTLRATQGAALGWLTEMIMQKSDLECGISPYDGKPVPRLYTDPTEAFPSGQLPLDGKLTITDQSFIMLMSYNNAKERVETYSSYELGEKIMRDRLAREGASVERLKFMIARNEITKFALDFGGLTAVLSSRNELHAIAPKTAPVAWSQIGDSAVQREIRAGMTDYARMHSSSSRDSMTP